MDRTELIVRAMQIVMDSSGRDGFYIDNNQEPLKEQTRLVLKIISELEQEMPMGARPPFK